MTAPPVKGWCPSTLRPMPSGDGLLVRVRPPEGGLSQAQMVALADLARAHGNGFVQLTNRANLQIRGVRDDTLAPLQAGLIEAGLLDPALTPEQEARLNIVVTPFHDGPEPMLHDTLAIARALHAALLAAEDLALPSKFGFAVDAAFRIRHLAEVSADVRIETAWDDLIVRADGLPTGRCVADADEAAALSVDIARWFVRSGGVATDGRGRMRDHVAQGAVLPAHLAGNAVPDCPSTTLQGFGQSGGMTLGLFGGMIRGDQLQRLAVHCHAGARVTPWRSFFVQGLRQPPRDRHLPRWIVQADDPRLRVTCCVGKLFCSNGLRNVGWAENHARHVPEGGHVHVSGCAKGCAHPGPAPVTLVGTTNGYGLVLNGRASDTPLHEATSARRLSNAAFHDPDLIRQWSHAAQL